VNIILKGRIVATKEKCMIEIKALNLRYEASTLEECVKYTEMLVKTKLKDKTLNIMFRIDELDVLYLAVPQSLEMIDLIAESLNDLEDIQFEPNLIKTS
jgi:hypothetical protein